MKYFFILFYFVSINTQAAYQALQIMTDERPPFEYIGDNGELLGIAVERVRCALDKIDVQYTIKVVLWARAQQMVKSGQTHGFFAASRNNGRDQYATLSDVVVEQYWNWYLSNDVAIAPNSEEFKKTITVSSWLGSNSLKWLTKQGYQVSQPSKSNTQLVKRLINSRVQGVYASNVVFEKAMADLGETLKKVKVVQGAYKPMGVYFSKKYLEDNSGFMQLFNQYQWHLVNNLSVNVDFSLLREIVCALFLFFNNV